MPPAREADPIYADAYEVLDLVCDGRGAYGLIATPDAGAELIRLDADGAERVETPLIGSAVHGYGLGALAATPEGACALLRSGRGLAWLRGSETRQQALPDLGRLGDPVWSPSMEGLILATERDFEGGHPMAALAFIRRDGAHRTLWTGADFITRPTLAPSGGLAFMTWDLPWTPWERSSVMIGSLAPDGQASPMVRVPTPIDAAVAQPLFGPHGALYFLCDATGCFELWRHDDGQARPLTQLGADIGLSLSRQASRSWVFASAGSALAVVWRSGVSKLVEIDLATGAARPIATAQPPGDLVGVAPKGFWYVGAPDEGPVSVRRRDAWGDRAVWTAPGDACHVSGPPAEILHMIARDGGPLQAVRFPAAHGRRRGLTVLNLHGGPKSLATRRLKGALRSLRDAGYDVVELNYRGSAGFGRAYRDRLDGHWGVADVEDVLTLVTHLEGSGLSTRDRIVLRGPSAGGFTALNVAAHHPGFAGIISYFGVSDLRALGATTHKFEAGYLKTLVGSADLDAPVFQARSPLTHAERISAPVLLLQGDSDPVVPPDQSIQLARRIEAAGGRCTLRMFRDEAHGFKRQETLRACLDLEMDFLARVG